MDEDWNRREWKREQSGGEEEVETEHLSSCSGGACAAFLVFTRYSNGTASAPQAGPLNQEGRSREAIDPLFEIKSELRLPQLLPVFGGHVHRQLQGAVGAGVERLFDDRHLAAADAHQAVFDALVEAVHLPAAAGQEDVVTQTLLEFRVERADQLV